MNLDLKVAYDYGREWIRQHEPITVDWLVLLASKVMARHDKGQVCHPIRNMEPAWEKVNGLKFQLVTYKDQKVSSAPVTNSPKRSVEKAWKLITIGSKDVPVP